MIMAGVFGATGSIAGHRATVWLPHSCCALLCCSIRFNFLAVQDVTESNLTGISSCFGRVWMRPTTCVHHLHFFAFCRIRAGSVWGSWGAHAVGGGAPAWHLAPRWCRDRSRRKEQNEVSYSQRLHTFCDVSQMSLP